MSAVEVRFELVGRDSLRLGDGGALLAATADDDGRAVHIHFSVADLVEPGPRECVLAGRDAFRDAVLEGSRVERTRIFANIPC